METINSRLKYNIFKVKVSNHWKQSIFETFSFLLKIAVPIATTRIISIKHNKGKFIANCIVYCTDYAKNSDKVNQGKYIRSYKYRTKTVQNELLMCN